VLPRHEHSVRMGARCGCRPGIRVVVVFGDSQLAWPDEQTTVSASDSSLSPTAACSFIRRHYGHSVGYRCSTVPMGGGARRHSASRLWAVSAADSGEDIVARVTAVSSICAMLAAGLLAREQRPSLDHLGGGTRTATTTTRPVTMAPPPSARDWPGGPRSAAAPWSARGAAGSARGRGGSVAAAPWTSPCLWCYAATVRRGRWRCWLRRNRPWRHPRCRQRRHGNRRSLRSPRPSRRRPPLLGVRVSHRRATAAATRLRVAVSQPVDLCAAAVLAWLIRCGGPAGAGARGADVGLGCTPGCPAWPAPRAIGGEGGPGVGRTGGAEGRGPGSGSPAVGMGRAGRGRSRGGEPRGGESCRVRWSCLRGCSRVAIRGRSVRSGIAVSLAAIAVVRAGSDASRGDVWPSGCPVVSIITARTAPVPAPRARAVGRRRWPAGTFAGLPDRGDASVGVGTGRRRAGRAPVWNRCERTQRRLCLRPVTLL
jgi:hypothetical protein